MPPLPPVSAAERRCARLASGLAMAAVAATAGPATACAFVLELPPPMFLAV